MKRFLVLTLSVSTCLLTPVAAQAAITATKTGAVLTLTSNNSGNVNETYTLRDEGSNVVVDTSPVPTADPDGGASDCTLTATGAACTRSAIDSVRVVAGTGVDTITDNRTAGPSVLEGGPGNDTITTTSGANADLLGQAGQDHLTSASSNDTLTGGDDADTLIAVGDHALDNSDSGGPGNDIFVGNPDREDHLPAEAGADTYNLGTHVATAVDDADTATLQRFSYPDSVSYGDVTEPVAVSLDGAANDGRAGEQDNVGADVETIYGGSAGDLLQAGPNAASFNGADGADQLLGGPGPDFLNGGAGNDVLRGGDGDDELDDGDFTVAITAGPLPPAGNDVLDGGSGDDYLQSDRGSDDLRGGPGVDRTTLSRPIPQAPSVTTPVAQAGFTVSLDDVANDGQTGTGEGDNIHSDMEDIDSSDGDDVITGSGAADDISTGAGNDVVDPGSGPDIVDLGSGDDRVTAVDQTTDIIRCGAGNDTATADLPGGQAVRADALTSCENVLGTPFPVIPPAAPPAGPALDTTRPIVTLSSKTITSKAFLRDGRLDVTVSCNEACSASGEATTTLARIARVGELSIGAKTLKLGTGKRTLQITVAKKFRTKLQSKLRTKAQRRRGLKFSVAVAAKDAAGNVTNVSRTVTVKG